MAGNKTKRATGEAKVPLRDRFSEAAFANIEPNDPVRRRASYKGERRRYHLRLPAPLVHDLAFISYLTGEAQNDFCQRALMKAAQKCLTDLKEEMPREHWNILSETFEKQRRK